MTTTEDVIRAAASVGRDAAEGRLVPSVLDAAVADECRELFGTVVGPSDPLWSVHLDVARQVLALGGLSADEFSEWLAVARTRAGDWPNSRAPSTEPPQAFSSASGPHRPESGDSDSDTKPSSDA
jgi:hypothetical protein